MIRIGCGFDVHAFVAGRKLMMGGVHIPFAFGLAGHSDADVLIHAVCDALLGALALGDIGVHFPDDDAAFADIDSLLLLSKTANIVRTAGGRILNIDASVALQRPKLAPHIVDMRQNMAAAATIDISQIGIKATTSERLGFVGREEGAAAFAVALLDAPSPPLPRHE